MKIVHQNYLWKSLWKRRVKTPDTACLKFITPVSPTLLEVTAVSLSIKQNLNFMHQDSTPCALVGWKICFVKRQSHPQSDAVLTERGLQTLREGQMADSLLSSQGRVVTCMLALVHTHAHSLTRVGDRIACALFPFSFSFYFIPITWIKSLKPIWNGSCVCRYMFIHSHMQILGKTTLRESQTWLT